jgi:hypothetical protein
VVGKDIFRWWCHVQKPSKYVTTSDEAMTILIVANSYEVWKEMAERKEQGEPKVRVEDCKSVHKFFKDERVREW